MSTCAIQPSHLKKQLRDTERLLKRPNLPSDIRREQERKRQHIQALIAERVENERIRQLKIKYAKVRFFESRKAGRHMKSASKALIAEPTAEKLAAWMEARRDVTYVHAFPLSQKYISLWPTYPITNAALLAQRAEIRMSLAREHKLEESLSLEDALAIAKAELTSEAPAKKQRASAVPMLQSLKRHGDSDDDEGDEDDDNDDDDGGDDDGEDAGEDGDGDDDNDGGDDDDESDGGAGGDMNDLPSNDDDDDDDDDEDDDDDDDDEDDDDEDESDDDDDDDEDDAEDDDDDDDDEDEEDDEEDDDDDDYESDEDDEDEEDEEEDDDDEPPKKRQK